MDYYHDADPLISSAISPGVIDFDPYSRPKIYAEESQNEIQMHLDSPDSMETYESEMDITFHDSRSVSSVASLASVTDEASDSLGSAPQKDDDADIESDRRLVSERFAPYNLFPVDNTWTLEERIEKLLELSPCTKYTKQDLLNIDAVESPEKKVDMLIDVVSKVHVNHRWNYVQPHELHRAYTVVANCKKEKKKDADGQTCPKRPMNAFMIWSMKCRALIAQITPQLHNAIISTKLGAAWRKLGDDEKALYEREKEVLSAFHKFEFPNYKYKPKKKAKRADEKPVSESKPKCLKRKRSESSPTVPLRGINIADARQSLDPMLKERLIVKMQVKIDPLLKKGIGKRVTAIDLSELTALHQNELTTTQSLVNSQHKFYNAASVVQLIIDSKPPSVFDTPENSPNKPNPPETPTESIINSELGGCSRSDRCFEFDDKSSILYGADGNEATIQCIPTSFIKSEPDVQATIKTEPDLQWNMNLSIKAEPLDYLGQSSSRIGHESIVESDQGCAASSLESNMPVLSAETVESVLDNEYASGFNSDELLDDFMKYLDNDICFSADLLPCVTTALDGPATV